MRAWREDLLSIDRRQKLVYFSHPKSGSFEIIEPGMVGIEQLVRTGTVHLRAEESEEGEGDTAVDLGLPAIDENRVFRVRSKTNQQIVSTCKRLHQRSEQEYADKGIWVLYLGLGMLTWVDPADKKKVSSPLLMVPVRLTKAGQVYVLGRTDDEPFLNTALSLKMSRDFGIELPDFDDDDVSIVDVAERVLQATSGQPTWTVDSRAILMPFSFHKEAMYKDLEQNEDTIISSDLIQLLSLGPEAPSAGSFAYEPPSDEQLDTVIAPENLHSILDADGSQRRCVIAARDGSSFVMDGPPGTGKSQTIANIIAELMATGKSVLFVSEKAAALDVVRDRLAARNLDPFLLELHSHKATRKQVVQTLHAELLKKPVARESFGAVEQKRLGQTRSELSAYAQAMNEVRRPLGRSLHDVLGRLSQLTGVENYPTGDKDTFSELSAEQLAMLLEHAIQLAGVWRPAEDGDAFLWRGLRGELMSMSDRKNAEDAALAAAKAVSGVVDAAQFFDSSLPFRDFDLNDDGLRQRLEVLKVYGVGRFVPASWWTIDQLDELDRRVIELRRITNERLTAIEEIAANFGAAWRSEDRQLFDALGNAMAADPNVFPEALGDMTVVDIKEAAGNLRGLIQNFGQLAEIAGKLGKLFKVDPDTVSMGRLQALIALARLSQSGNLPEANWLNPSVQGALDESARVLDNLTAMVREREETLNSVFKPEVLDLDLVGLKVRFAERKGFKVWSKQAREDKKTLRGVTQSGGAGKEIIARLDEALAWQQAQRDLSSGETEYSPRLGEYYHGTSTDFGRLSAALEVAREAIRLAGQDIAPGALASQIARGTEPEFDLIPTADRAEEQLSSVREEVRSLLHSEYGSALYTLPLPEVLTLLGQVAERLSNSSAERERLEAMGGSGLTLHACVEGIGKIGMLHELEAAVEAAATDDAELIGSRYQRFETDWDETDADRKWCREVRDVVKAPLDATAVPFLEEFRPEDHSLVGLVDTWRAARENLLDFFAPVQRTELENTLNESLSSADALLEEMADSAATDIDVWFEFSRLTNVMAREGMSDVIPALEAKAAPAAEVCDAVERAALEPWAESVIGVDERLKSHRADNRDQLVGSFQELDNRLVQEAFSAVVTACAARRPRSNAGPAAVIAHEANKKTRHKPIRRLLAETAGLAQALKPCFMMSPLSVSQYLPSELKFDVVIFDEASQVMPADAVNCIYRGRQLMVAGDQKQLPPTRFFASADAESEDEEAPDDFDSVLDLCKASGSLPSLPLTWHYRSRHEDLITYSNYRFYEGKLSTFPGATHEAGDLGVHHEYVADGVYRRGGDRSNPIEAERVVDRIVEHRRNNSDLSLGVVTFSTAQADAVSDAIERRVDTEPLLRGLMEDHDRLHGFFVKNLESVQGDERDIIIFSIGYGPDEHGKFTMMFGPLTKKGGERRLNVAITRARRRVEIVSSFRSSDMQETGSDGNRHLKNYLDFAERGHSALAEDMSGSVGDVESPFEEEVVRTIRSWGYGAVSQVGSAGYRIDIGVPHPDQPGRFVLGVECDGAAYHSAKTARDRDRLRESVLRGLGWEIHRIWGISWYRDRATQEERLKAAIQQAIRAADQPKTQPKTAKVEPMEQLEYQEVDLEAAPEWTVPYRKYSQRDESYRYEPGKVDALPDLISYCSAVLSVEAPVHVDTVLERVKADWGVGRAGSQIQKNVRQALGMARVNGSRAKVYADGFVRVPGDESTPVRTPDDDGDIRKVNLIPPEEIEEAVVRVVADAVFANEEQIKQTVRGIFGWNRSGNDIQTAVQKALFKVVKNRRCVKDDSGNYFVA